MKKKNRIIVIPIYKREIDKFEIVSLNRCCEIFNNEEICLLTYSQLDLSLYECVLKSYKIKFYVKLLNKPFFIGIEGYNTLCLNRILYSSFQEYEWMLIYQLDAYVFRNDLDKFCNTEYMYWGAPTFKDTNFLIPQHVLNGGLSLRNISYSLSVFDGLSYYWRFCKIHLKKDEKWKKKSFLKIPWLLFQAFCLKNEVPVIFKTRGIWALTYEDYVWCAIAQSDKRLPPFSEAAKFSFENCCNELYRYNNNQLPLGCHAWYKFGNYDFWKKYINV